jgi:predicted nucleic acid-binding protein
MIAVDTNVPFYAHDPRDPAKQKVATSLIASLTDGALLWQVACEYLWASRKLEPLGYSYVHAVEDIRDLRRVWTNILPDWKTLDRAESLKAGYSLSFWGALIIAACLEAGVQRLFSEDFGSQSIDALEITNPF